MKLITKKFVPVFLLSLTTTFCLGQVQTNFIKPIQTDSGYSSTEDSSAVSRNTNFHYNKLFLFIGGTNSSSSTDYDALRLHSANLGFDFINLSYPNDVAAASLGDEDDSLAFDKYRQELCFGIPASDAVNVDTLNSIYTRTLKLIQYLDATYPSENWGQYLTSPNTIDWSKIIVGGHSQGAGHACYLAKQFLVDRVLMFSGPNDYSNYFSNSAYWLRDDGETPANNHFAYLSLNDEIIDFSKQFVNISGLGMLANDDTTQVDNNSPPFGNSKCLYTTQSPGIALLHHNVPIKFSTINQNVWTYMLTTEVTTGIGKNTEVGNITIFPNPTTDYIFLNFGVLQSKMSYSIYNLSGQLVKSGIHFEQTKNHMIDISNFELGAYILVVNGLSKKIIKK